MRHYSWIYLILVGLSVHAQTTDSVRLVNLSYEEAKGLLLKQNLTLLASFYDVSAAEADLVQSKLWSNPNVVWNQELYSVEQNKYFNARNQNAIQIQQTFSIAGKHTNTVKLSKVGVELSKYQLQDVLRSLLFELGDVYFSLHEAQKKQELYIEMLSRYDQLINSAKEKQRVGALAANEVLRLRSEQIAIRADATENNNEVLEMMSQLRMLLNFADNVSIQTVEKDPSTVTIEPLYLLVNTAIETRPDYKLHLSQIQYEERNLKLQRSLAMPDISLGYQPTDKGSNYVRPYQGLTMQLDLPLFNRNQGNIKLAQSRISQSELKAQQVENTLRNEVQKSYEQLMNTRKGYEEFSDEFIKQTEELNINANENYQKKNINLLEFIDLQRIYIRNKTQQIELKNVYLKSINQLNFAIGKEIIN